MSFLAHNVSNLPKILGEKGPHKNNSPLRFIIVHNPVLVGIKIK